MINQMISFHPENCPSPTSRIHPPVTNKCRHFSTGSCKPSHLYGGTLPHLALCSMLLFLLNLVSGKSKKRQAEKQK